MVPVTWKCVRNYDTGVTHSTPQFASKGELVNGQTRVTFEARECTLRVVKKKRRR